MSETQKHTKPNVPNLRFPGFDEEWRKTHLSQMGDIIGGGTPDTTIAEYWNGNILWFTPSEVGKEKYVSDSNRKISLEGLKNSSAKILPKQSILLSSRATVGECSINLKECCTNQGFQSFIPNNSVVSTEFLYYRLLTHKRDFIRKACGSTFLEISARQIAKISSYLPEKKEQDKIASLLSLIDKRISIQSKVIEDLKKLKTALCEKFLVQISNSPLAELRKHCSITTGKLDANAMSESGKYMFFTCAKENYRTDTYAFEGDALLISGNGELGLCKYYSGKFNAYQRTYVLQNFDMDIQFAKLMIDSFLPRKIYREKNVGAMPYIVLSTLSELQIPVPDCEIQTRISTVLNTFANKIELEECVLTKLILMKNHILSQMFI